METRQLRGARTGAGRRRPAFAKGRMRGVARKRDRKSRSLVGPVALGDDGSSVCQNELSDDSQAQSQAAVSARGRSVGLLKWLKKAWQERRIDSLAVVGGTEDNA